MNSDYCAKTVGVSKSESSVSIWNGEKNSVYLLNYDI